MNEALQGHSYQQKLDYYATIRWKKVEAARRGMENPSQAALDGIKNEKGEDGPSQSAAGTY